MVQCDHDTISDQNRPVAIATLRLFSVDAAGRAIGLTGDRAAKPARHGIKQARPGPGAAAEDYAADSEGRADDAILPPAGVGHAVTQGWSDL